MRLERFEAHLNELLHDLSSPLNSMRLQLGLLRDALKTDDRLLRRVESTERQVLRSQRIIDAFVTACSVKEGRVDAGRVVRRVLERYGFVVEDETNAEEVAVCEDSLAALIRCLADGCVALMKPGTLRAGLSADDGFLLVRVEGEFEQRIVGRALRLSFVHENGEPMLGLAIARLAAAAAYGTLLLERNALVLRLPLAKG